MKILAIESSCDETATAVVEDGRHVLSSVIASQVEEHKIYGGVVPEIASRRHTEAISQITTQALAEANCTMDDIDAVYHKKLNASKELLFEACNGKIGEHHKYMLQMIRKDIEQTQRLIDELTFRIAMVLAPYDSALEALPRTVRRCYGIYTFGRSCPVGCNGCQRRRRI